MHALKNNASTIASAQERSYCSHLLVFLSPCQITQKVKSRFVMEFGVVILIQESENIFIRYKNLTMLPL